MGKKRKAGGRYGQPSTATESHDDDAKLAIDTYQDVADSEDEFHINRDKILLDEGPAAKRLRKWKEADQFLEQSDEEVLDYRGLDDDEEASSDDDSNGDAENDDNDASGHDIEDEDVDEDGWGPSKKDYYDADAIETEQDALDEEAEAKRIQKKQLLAMTAADYAFDQDEWLDREGQQETDTGVVSEVLPKWHIPADLSDAEKLRILRTRYPEFEHLASEFLRLQPLHDELAATANAAARLINSRVAKSGTNARTTQPTPVAVVKYRACATYLAAISMYFAILGSTANDVESSPIAMDPAELHDHPVMESLLKCQQIWAKVESLPVADPMVEASYGDDLSIIEEASPVSDLEESSILDSKYAKVKKSKSQRAAEAAKAKSDARRAEKLRKTEQELASLATLADANARKATKKRMKKAEPSKLNLLNPEDSDFGEETELTAHELAEKARKKKSLRFYTSQITQKANKRDAAGKDYGGDADIPHRERLKDRQARLQALAEKKGQSTDKGPGVPLGEGDDSSDDNDGELPNNDLEDAEGYYDMVAARSTAKKQSKLDRAAAYALAAKEGGVVIPEEIIGEDGRRQITYAIEKNKGLTPHRKKSVRNPRLKKRLAFEAKKKKLKSMKPVFDASKRASGAAAYGGELTGIKKGLVRSRKL
ncbi:Sas10/Utp3 family protein [Periconia macrospinosa]|uniref:Sas10/Utp3 family protein n=1 Tax=Periconia macrospinosa TaxID=97972 RepID=A0A2V1EGW4_9PLEO|nr:Sas10/Utp3 family protein [Periconia macrospinosa]